MTTFIMWLNNRVFLALLLAAGLSVDLVLIGLHYCLDSSEWASWVQAVGSIAAILGLVWAARHATTVGRREAKKNACEASIAQLIFLRSVLASAGIVARDLDYHAENFDAEKVASLSKSLVPLLQTIEALAMRVNDHEIARLVALTYEHLILFQMHTASIVPALATGLVNAGVMAKFNQMHIENTLTELDQIGARLGAPPRPLDE